MRNRSRISLVSPESIATIDALNLLSLISYVNVFRLEIAAAGIPRSC